VTAGQRISSPNGLPHRCPAADVGLARQLAGLVSAEPWLLRALGAVAASGLPDAWIGAGVIRDVIWGQRQDGFDPADVRDIDVAFFDPEDLSGERDQEAQRALARLDELPWEATNQAAVHTWFHEYFGGSPVPPFGCVHDAVATWPETATCVAIRRLPADASPGAAERAPAADAGSGQATSIEVCSPHGLADLLGMVWRPNPARVTADMSAARLDRQRKRFPGITVAPPHSPFPAPAP
jgi:hypothetical protein